MPTPSEIEALEPFIRGAIKTAERVRLGLEKEETRTTRQILIDQIYKPNELLERLMRRKNE